MMPSIRSTKAHLTFYFTAVFGAIVVCLGLASYAVVNRAGYSDLDSGLHVAVIATAMSAQHEFGEHTVKGEGEADLQVIMNESLSQALPDTQILIREGDRTVAYKGSNPQTVDLRSLPSRQLRSQTNVAGLRVAAQALQINRFQTVYEIYSASALSPVLHRLELFRQMLFVCVPLGLALAAFGGYLLAQRALSPLSELTRTIETVTSADLSARVRVASSDGELGWLAGRFNSLLDRLETAFHVQRQFMADASHQLRTPLTVALSAAQVTARDGKRTMRDCEEALVLVETQLLRLRRILDNMFFLSQADATSLAIEKREFYLDDAISEAVRAANVLAKAKRQNIRIESLPEARCLGDEELLRQALLILLENSVKYTQEGGQVSVVLSRAGDVWSCQVRNNGPAVPVDAQSRIFERFYRGPDGEAAKTSGAGLGLAIAKSIAETHGGDLRLVSSHPGLTVFEMRIPVLAASAESEIQAKSLAVKM